MTTATDTLASAETLQEAGVPSRQAAAHSRVVEAACAGAVDGLATRADLKATKAELQADLKSLEVRLVLYGVSLGGLLFAALRFG